MSRIYFHSPRKTEEVSGSERAYMDILLRDFFIKSLNVQNADDPILNIIPKNSLIYEDLTPAKTFARFVDYSMFGGKFQLGSIEENVYSAITNTALQSGLDAYVFAARIHAQCEIHGYVEGKNRKWLANIITNALKDNILRTLEDDTSNKKGWKKVIKMLQERDDEPVVTSYSVCDSFPNAYIAQWEDDNDGEDFDRLKDKKRWKLSMKSLRAQPKYCSLEWKPKTWSTAKFGNGYSALTLREYANSLKKT